MGATGIEPMTSTVSRLTLVVNLIDSLCVFLLHLGCCYVIFGAYWTQNGLTFYLFSPLSSRVFPGFLGRDVLWCRSFRAL